MSTTDLTPLNDLVRLQRDRQAIAELITRLGVMLDEKRLSEARSIVSDDVFVETASGPARGPDAVVEKARRNHTVRTQHVFTDLQVELEAHRAHARANLILTFAPDQPGSHLVIGGSEQPGSHLTIGDAYRFQAVRTDDGWRLARIEAERRGAPSR